MKNNYTRKSLFLKISMMIFLDTFGIFYSINAQPCTNPPTSFAGNDTAICPGTYNLSGTLGGSASYGFWTSSGTGTFSPSDFYFGDQITYMPSSSDLSSGSVVLTLTSDDPDGEGDCLPAASSFTLTFNAAPTVSVSGMLSICSGGSTVLTANASSGSGSITTYSWARNNVSIGSNTSTLNVNAAGNYHVTVTNSNFCSATSTDVAVQIVPVIDSVVATPASSCTGDPVSLSVYAGESIAGPQTLTTVYPVSSALDIADDEILNVSFGSLNNTSTCGSTGGPNSFQNMYSDYTNLPPTVVYLNQSVPFSVTVGYCGGQAFSNVFAIYIDYDRDGTFDQAGEEVYVNPYISSSVTGTAYGGNIVIPSTASLGLTMMRVVLSESSSVTPSGYYNWGETEDYLVDIQFFNAQNPSYNYEWNPTSLTGPTINVNPVSNTTYVVTVTEPISGCSATGSVNVTVNNKPATPIAGSPSSQCGYGIPTVSVSGTGGSFLWYYSSTGGVPISGETLDHLNNTYINSSTNFYVSEFNGQCESDRVLVIANVTDPDPVTAAATSPTCTNSTLTLSFTQTGATNNYNDIQWTATPSSGSGIPGTAMGNNVVVQPTASGTYTYTVTVNDNSSGCATQSFVTVTINDPPTIDSLTASPAQSCTNAPVVLHAVSNITDEGTSTAPTGYCTALSQGEICIFDVTLNSLSTSTSTCSFPYYISHSPSGNETTSLLIGSTYTLSVTLHSSSIYPSGGIVSVWIDWNRDGIYDPAEWYQPFTSALTGSVQITVPANASTGLTGMRIRSRGSNNPNGDTDACTDMGSGSTEDFFISVISIIENPNVVYSWNPGSISGGTITVNPATSTVYTVTVTDNVTACVNSGTVAVNVSSRPAAPVATNSTQCGYGIPTASVSGSGGFFNWYTDLTGGNPIPGETGNQLNPNGSIAVSTDTVFYVSEFDGTCESDRVPVQVNVTPSDPVTASASANSICDGSSSILSVLQSGNNNSYSFSWNASPLAGSGLSGSTPGDASGTLTVLPTLTGTYVYTVIATDAAASCVATSTVSVTVNEHPVINSAIANPDIICAGNTSTLDAISLVNTSGPTITPNGYCTTGLSEIGCVSDMITNVTFATINRSSGCDGTSTNGYSFFSAPNPVIYSGNTYAISISAGFDVEGVTVWIDYDRDGVFASAEAVFTPMVDYSGGGLYTGNITIPSTISPGATVMRVRCAYYYNPDPSEACAYHYGAEIEDYEITLVASLPNPNVTFEWNPGSLSGGSVVVAPVSTTTYIVTATDITGCTSTASAVVSVINSGPTPIADANPLSICYSGFTTLSVLNLTPGLVYTWQSSPSGLTDSWTDIGTGSPLDAPAITSSTYYRVYSTCGINGDTSVSILVNVYSPEVSGAPGINRCGPGMVTMNVTGNGHFNWYANYGDVTPVYSDQSTVSTVINTSTTFWIEAYDGPCVAINRYPLDVTINPSPEVIVSANPGSSICANEQLSLSASSINDPDYTYEWSLDGTTVFATGSVITVNPTSSATYYLNATDNTTGPNSGCGFIVATPITVNNLPDIPVISSTATTLCTTGECAQLSIDNVPPSSPGSVTVGNDVITNITSGQTPYSGLYEGYRVQYLITANELASASMVAGNITSLSLNVSGGYSANLGDFAIKIAHTSLTALDVTESTDPFTTVYGPVTLSPNFGLNQYIFSTPFLWDGVSNIVVEICSDNDPSGTCSFCYSDNTGVLSTTTSYTSVRGYYQDNNLTCGTVTGILTTGSDRPNMLFDAMTGTPITYIWNPGNFSGSVFNACPTSTTTYTVTASTPSGCNSTSSITINVGNVPEPVINSSGPTTLCQGGSTTLDAGSGYTDYSWSDGNSVVGTSQTLTVAPSATTTYTVTVDDGGNCSATSSIIITIDQITPPVISGSNEICQGNSTVLDAGNGYNSYEWSNGAGIIGTSSTIQLSTAGTYSVTVSNSSGCTASSSVSLIVHPTPPPAIITPAGPLTVCFNSSNPVQLFADTTGTGAGGSIIWNEAFNFSGATYNVYWNDINLQSNGNTYDFSVSVTDIYGCTSFSDSVTVSAINCGGITLNLQLFLQGYYQGSSSMQPVLANQGVPGANLNQTDTIRVELYDAADPSILVESMSSMLLTNGSASAVFNVSPGSYYIVIRHRNTIETWSAGPVGIPGNYDFTTTSTQAFGDNMVLVDPNTWALYTGDINQDDFIDIFDFPVYDIDNQNFVSFSYVATDLNGDGFVDIFDFPIYDNNNQSFIFSIHP